MKCFVPVSDEMLFNSNDLKHYQLVPYNNEYVYLKDSDILLLKSSEPILENKESKISTEETKSTYLQETGLQNTAAKSRENKNPNADYAHVKKKSQGLNRENQLHPKSQLPRKKPKGDQS